MKRFELSEDTWSKYTAMMTWLRDNFGECGVWEKTWFEPKKPEPPIVWYMGTHKRSWHTRKQDICVWMPDEVYTAFVLRFL